MSSERAVDSRGNARLPPVGFEPAFVTSYGGLALATGFVSLAHARAVSSGLFHLNVGAISQAMDLGVRLHERAGVFASLGGVLAGGVDDLSLYDFGVEAAFRYKVGVSGVLLQASRWGTQVTAHFVVAGAVGGRVGIPATLVQDLVEHQRLPKGDALFGARAVTSVRMAWSASRALTRRLGMQMGFGLVSTKTTFPQGGTTVADHAMSATLGAEVTAALTSHAPLAIRFEADADVRLHRELVLPASPLSLVEGDNSLRMLLGLYYIGRGNLVLGGNGGIGMAEGQGIAWRAGAMARLDFRYVF